MRNFRGLRWTAALLLVGLGASIGAASSPVIHTIIFGETGRLAGHLGAVQFRPTIALGCDSEPNRATAYSAFALDQLAKTTLARVLAVQTVEAVQAVQPCVVLATRFGKNLIVNAGENFLVDAWQNIVELEIMKFHGDGTGTTAAAEGDTGLVTEATTSHNPDNTRATGSLTEGASANIFRTVGTNTFDATAAITEWALFTQSATGGGTMWSRIVFSAINVASGDSVQYTYEATAE